MRVALVEMRRRPARFLRVGAALAVLVLLLLSLGGLTDGLSLNATAALSSVEGDLIVLDDDARLSLLRSRLDDDTVDTIGSVEGVGEVQPFGVALMGSVAEGEPDTIPAAVLGITGGLEGVDEPPGPGEAIVDEVYRDEYGVRRGDSIALGPMAIPVTVTGFVPDAPFLYQAAVRVDDATWREVLTSFRPDAAFAPSERQVVVVTATDGTDPLELAEQIDRATDGATETVTVEEAGLALPGVSQQASTFGAIIGVTFLVVGIVVAMFFVLLTIEHLPLFAVLKAVGASNRQVVAGVVAQAVGVAALGCAIGIALTLAASRPLAAVAPVQLQASRYAQVLVGVVVVSVLGSLVSLRRVVRVEAVSVIG